MALVGAHNANQLFSRLTPSPQKPSLLGSKHRTQSLCALPKIALFPAPLTDRLLQYNFELLDKHRTGLDEVKHPVCLNLAAVRLRYGFYSSAITLCKEVLKEDKNNAKAFYRRAQAFKCLKQYDNAKEDIAKAYKLVPSDTKVYELYREIKTICAREEAKVVKFWKGRLVKEPKPFSVSGLLSIRNPLNLFYWLF